MRERAWVPFKTAKSRAKDPRQISVRLADTSGPGAANIQKPVIRVLHT